MLARDGSDGAPFRAGKRSREMGPSLAISQLMKLSVVGAAVSQSSLGPDGHDTEASTPEEPVFPSQRSLRIANLRGQWAGLGGQAAVRPMTSEPVAAGIEQAFSLHQHRMVCAGQAAVDAFGKAMRAPRSSGFLRELRKPEYARRVYFEHRSAQSVHHVLVAVDGDERGYQFAWESIRAPRRLPSLRGKRVASAAE